MFVVTDQQIEAIRDEIAAEILKQLGISVVVDAGTDEDDDLVFVASPFPLEEQELYNEIVSAAVKKILKVGYG